MGIAPNIMRLPVNIIYKGSPVCAEIIGKTFPFNKYFTCRIPGADMIIIEALPSGTPGKFLWGVCFGKELGYMLSHIGRAIEQHLSNQH